MVQDDVANVHQHAKRPSPLQQQDEDLTSQDDPGLCRYMSLAPALAAKRILKTPQNPRFNFN